MENIFTSLSQPGSQGENTLKFRKIIGLLFDISWRKTSNLRTYSENLNKRSTSSPVFGPGEGVSLQEALLGEVFREAPAKGGVVKGAHVSAKHLLNVHRE